eukprot:scaffold99857_cov27-Tisochrysis_lutea.AAC.1
MRRGFDLFVRVRVGVLIRASDRATATARAHRPMRRQAWRRVSAWAMVGDADAAHCAPSPSHGATGAAWAQ